MSSGAAEHRLSQDGAPVASDTSDAGSPASGRPVSRRAPLPELAVQPIVERLDQPPVAAPSSSEKPMVKARRNLISEPGKWMLLATRTNLNEANARRLVHSFKRAKPARLDPTATGKFDARVVHRNNRWQVAAVYQPPHPAHSVAPQPVTGPPQ